jgi:hypothetical protein
MNSECKEKGKKNPKYEKFTLTVIDLMCCSNLFRYFAQLFYITIFPISPSGCTFWGKKPWSRKKKILWQLGTLVGAPVGIALIAGIAIPAMIIGIPVYVGRKVKHTRPCQCICLF